MGMPVITLSGSSHVDRVGASLLTTVGLSELVAPNTDEYVQTAVALAKNDTHLDTLRSSIRHRLLSSPLCNAPRFTANYEHSVMAAFEVRQ